MSALFDHPPMTEHYDDVSMLDLEEEAGGDDAGTTLRQPLQGVQNLLVEKHGRVGWKLTSCTAKSTAPDATMFQARFVCDDLHPMCRLNAWRWGGGGGDPTGCGFIHARQKARGAVRYRRQVLSDSNQSFPETYSGLKTATSHLLQKLLIHTITTDEMYCCYCCYSVA